MLLPLLHAEAPTSFWAAWAAHPHVIASLVLLVGCYTVALRQLGRTGGQTPATWRVASYYSGMALLAIALLGPLDVLNDSIFFLHMLQHAVLMQIAAPLIALGQPLQVVMRALPRRYNRLIAREVLARPRVRRVTDLILHPVPAFLLFNVVMVIWHIPRLYQAVLDNDLLHDAQHISFFVTAYLCWWLIVDPVPRHRKLPIPWAIGPLFLTAMIGSAVGAMLTLSESIVYEAYLNPSVVLWNLSSLNDQQIAGLIMWVGGGFLYFSIIFLLLIRMLGTGDSETNRSPEGERVA